MKGILAFLEEAGGLKRVERAGWRRRAVIVPFSARTGDLLPGTPGKKEAEEKAMRSLLASLPKELKEEYRRLWEEYSAGKGKEARLVKEADRLEMLLQALEYYREVQRRVLG